MDEYLGLDTMRKRYQELSPYLTRTPVCRWEGRKLNALLPEGAEVTAKLEIFQKTGTFKARGALSNVLALTPEQRARGITGASAGNHAIAIAFAAQAVGVHAKVVMQSSANPARIEAARSYGAELIMAVDGKAAFARVDAIAREEGRAVIHPFEGYNTVLGTAGVGLELMEDAPNLEAIVVAVGGGGLVSGIAAAVRAMKPDCQVFGVEPAGADSMSRSIAKGQPITLDRIDTIADSLAPPMALPYTFSICQSHLEDIVTVTDAELCHAMALMFQDRALAVEPAAAATTAAIIGPLRERLRGKKIGIIICGSNIDIDRYCEMIRRGLN